MCAASVMITMCRIGFSLSASFSTSGTKVRSTKRTRSSAWLTMYSICSWKSRGLMVWHTAPMPETPK